MRRFADFITAYFQFGHGTDVLPESAYFLVAVLFAAAGAAELDADLVGAGDFRDVDAGRVSADVLLRSARRTTGRCLPIRRRVRWPSPARTNYKGERGVWVFQNLHRYFLYLALLLVVMHVYHVIEACRWPAAGGGMHVRHERGHAGAGGGFGVPRAVRVLVPFAAALGGRRLDCFSGSSGETRYKLWKCCTRSTSITASSFG